jgi:hypothetical protein
MRRRGWDMFTWARAPAMSVGMGVEVMMTNSAAAVLLRARRAMFLNCIFATIVVSRESYLA